jgi:DNA-binding HxlR family transcriptional regulator
MKVSIPMPRKSKTISNTSARNDVLVRAAKVRALLVACIKTSEVPLTLAAMIALPGSKLLATGMNREELNNQLNVLVKDGLITRAKSSARGVAVEYWDAKKGPKKADFGATSKALQEVAQTGSSELNKLLSKRDAFNAEIDKKITLLRVKTIEDIVGLMQVYGIATAELVAQQTKPKEGKA